MNYLSLVIFAIFAFVIKDRSNFELVFPLVCILYGIHLKQLFLNFKPIKNWVLWAMSFRLLFIVSLPYLSDDIYRFIWDGALQSFGVNPFVYTPKQIINLGLVPQSSFFKDLYPLLNSPNYFSVYPPVNQALFALSGYTFDHNINSQVVGLRAILLIFEFGNLLLLQFFSNYFKKPKLALLYALNPLIILEISGNLHFEGVMIFFVLLSLFLYLKFKNWIISSAFFFAASIATKLLPLVLLPIIMVKIGFKKGLLFSSLALSFFVITFIPYFNSEVISNFTQSVDLFFRNFEFNASLYYLGREIGFQIWGYNVIQTLGLLLKAIALLGILYISLFKSHYNTSVLFILSIFLFTATTVHPWYLIPLLTAGFFTNLKYPVVWSFLVFLSYQSYSGIVFQENLWLVALEYLILTSFIIYEFKNNAFRRSVSS